MAIFDSGELTEITEVPDADKFEQWKQRLFSNEIEAIHLEFGKIIGGLKREGKMNLRNTNTVDLLPAEIRADRGMKWQNTPFWPIYQVACEQDWYQAGWCIGLLFFEYMMYRDDKWICWQWDSQEVPMGCTFYCDYFELVEDTFSKDTSWYFSYGQSCGGPDRIRGNDSVVQFSGNGEDTEESQPTALEWDAFWLLVDSLDALSWQGNYDTHGIMDGAPWHLTLKYLENESQCSGNGHGEHAPPGFRRLFRAIIKLARTPIFYPSEQRAYHEAGHLLKAWSINPDWVQSGVLLLNSSGWEATGRISLRGEFTEENRCEVAVAGLLAEARVIAMRPVEWDYYKLACQLVDHRKRRSPFGTQAIQLPEGSTARWTSHYRASFDDQDYLSLPAHFHDNTDQLASILQSVADFVNQHWHQIDLVGEELCETGRISGAGLNDLLK